MYRLYQNYKKNFSKQSSFLLNGDVSRQALATELHDYVNYIEALES